MSNPYELRQQLLHQAQSILGEQYRAKVDALRTEQEFAHRNGEQPKAVTWPSPPTSEDIVKEAQKLYEFICKK